MTGLKSGSGDDLWGDDSEEEEEEEEEENTTADSVTKEPIQKEEATENSSQRVQSPSTDDSTEPQSSTITTSTDQAQSYLVRRAVQDKSVQFEREERLTFFVHDDVVDGERDLLTDLESTLGRDVPKFDIREAVYRAALRNRDDVLKELLEMGYTLDEE